MERHEKAVYGITVSILTGFVLFLALLVGLSPTEMPTGHAVKGIEIAGEMSLSIATAVMGIAIGILVVGLFAYTYIHHKKKD